MNSPVSCAELVELVTDYFDRALSTADQARFEEHLQECPGCTNYVAQLREMVRLTGNLTAADITQEACDALLAAFRTFSDRDPGHDG